MPAETMLAALYRSTGPAADVLEVLAELLRQPVERPAGERLERRALHRATLE